MTHWTRTHTASLDGNLVPLHGRPGREPGVLELYEKDAASPSWIIGADGKLARLAGRDRFDHGVVTEYDPHGGLRVE